jgi:hypothetical protein
LKYDLLITSIHQTLSLEWFRHLHTWKDRIVNEGEDSIHRELISTFRSKIRPLYPEETLQLWLEEYGLGENHQTLSP